MKKYSTIVFDLDDTLALSKTSIDDKMSILLEKLLEKYYVSIISWWKSEQFFKQVIEKLWNKKNYNKLILLPTCWASMIVFKNNNREKQYSFDFNKQEKEKIIKCLEFAINKLWFKPDMTWWEIIEDRETQITYSALWQSSPYEIKEKRDPNWEKRMKILEIIREDLKEFDIKIWWKTSVDITKKWIDKKFWIIKLKEYLDIWIKDMLFIWDQMKEWWNDFSIISTWIDYIETKWVEDTKLIINNLLW